MVSVFTSGYVNAETILHFFYKITNERGTKTMFIYAHVKWFYGQSEHAYYLNYFIKPFDFSLLFWLQADMFDLFAHIVFQRNGKSKAQFY